MSMAATPHGLEGNLAAPVLHVALELGAKQWKVGFTPGLGRSPRIRTLPAGDLEGLERVIERARRRFGLPESGASPAWLPPPTRVARMTARPASTRPETSGSAPWPPRSPGAGSAISPKSDITRWFNRRFVHAGKPARRRGTTAVARKLLIALWHYLEHGVVPDGAVFKDA